LNRHAIKEKPSGEGLRVLIKIFDRLEEEVIKYFIFSKVFIT